MARFLNGGTGFSPLKLQLSSSGVVVLTGWSAGGDNSLGQASAPSISRPSTIGTGTGPVSQPLSGDGLSSVATFISSFSGSPSLPAVGYSNASLPQSFSWAAPLSQGLIASNGGALLLYASTTGGHTYSASMIWEEL